MRSIWKGHIRFSLVTIPIRIYTAIDPAQTISFHLLHKEDHGRIGYEKRCKKDGHTVTNEDIVKGYEFEPDQYVIMEPEDFEKVRLKSTRVIEIAGFVKASDVNPSLYETPYYAGPDGDVAVKVYALLREALRESGKVGIGKVVLRDREDVVMISPLGEGLVLYKLRYPVELRNITDVPQLDQKAEADREQLKLAHHLLDTMTTSFSKLHLKDEYENALRELIAAKVEGKEIVTYKEEIRPAVDIMTALKRSIEQAKEQREPMLKATGKEKGRKAAQTPAKARRGKGA